MPLRSSDWLYHRQTAAFHRAAGSGTVCSAFLKISSVVRSASTFQLPSNVSTHSVSLRKRTHGTFHKPSFLLQAAGVGQYPDKHWKSTRASPNIQPDQSTGCYGSLLGQSHVRPTCVYADELESPRAAATAQMREKYVQSHPHRHPSSLPGAGWLSDTAFGEISNVFSRAILSGLLRATSRKCSTESNITSPVICTPFVSPFLLNYPRLSAWGQNNHGKYGRSEHGSVLPAYAYCTSAAPPLHELPDMLF